MIGERLRLARTAAGLTLRDVAAEIEGLVTAQAISLYERDASMPSDGVLEALADALQLPVTYLSDARQMNLEFVKFRTKGPTSNRERGQLEAQVLHMLERYLDIEGVLGLRTGEWDKPRAAPYPVVAEPGEADRAAQAVRNTWGLGIDPIANVAELLEDRGIKVLATDLTTQVHGLTARVRGPNGTVPVIVVRRMKWGDRQRFTMAHELGHLLMKIDKRFGAEEAAHRFAGAFLMPAEALWNAMGQHRTCVCLRELCDLKAVFGVSAQALAHRCRDLGIISGRFFKQLTKEFAARRWSVAPFEEPAAIPKEEPTRFRRLCLRALTEGAISKARCAELLGVRMGGLHQLMHEPDDRTSGES